MVMEGTRFTFADPCLITATKRRQCLSMPRRRFSIPCKQKRPRYMHKRLRFLIIAFLAFSFTRGAIADDGIAAIAEPGSNSLAPAWFIEIPDSVSDVLVADAATAMMWRFVRSGDSIVEKDRRYMSIGLNGTGKQRAWDKRTPLGVYFITEEIDTSGLHEKYGVAAYALDYPNAWDRYKERTGNGIWLHGVDRRKPTRPPRDTDGCLALPNEEIMLLDDVLEPRVTPVIVARELSWTTTGEVNRLRTQLRNALDAWKDSLASGDLDTHLSLYAEDFRSGEMDRDEWSSYRASVFESGLIDGVVIDELMLLADPEEPNLYLSRFTQYLVTGTGPVTSTKRLYWRHTDDKRWVIVSEDSG